MCVQALCEQVSLRISSIDGVPVPTVAAAVAAAAAAGSAAAATGSAAGLRRWPEGPGDGDVQVADPASVSHLLFEPTLLSRCERC